MILRVAWGRQRRRLANVSETVSIVFEPPCLTPGHSDRVVNQGKADASVGGVACPFRESSGRFRAGVFPLPTLT